MTERKAETVWRGRERIWGCTARVSGSGHWGSSRCAHKAKYDPDANGNPTKCGVHSEEAAAKRKAVSDEKYEAIVQASKRRRAEHTLANEAMCIVREIADGHNDPTTLAKEWVKRKDEI